MLILLLKIIGTAIVFDILACTIGVLLLDQIVIALLKWSRPDQDSNRALKEWLFDNPEKEIDQYPFLHTSNVNPHTNTETPNHASAFRTYQISPVTPRGDLG